MEDQAGGFDELAGRVPFLRALAPADLERLRPYAFVRKVARGEPVWREGDPTGEFMFVASGRLKMSTTQESGREVILEMAAPGDLLCGNAPCSFRPYCCTASALEDEAVVVVLPRRDLLDLLERSPAAARAFLREVTARGLALRQRIDELAAGQVERRLATLLVRLADDVGTAGAGREVRIPVRLSRQDLADLVGTTLETAIRVMTRLGREGVLRTERRGIVITNRPALERFARGDR